MKKFRRFWGAGAILSLLVVSGCGRLGEEPAAGEEAIQLRTYLVPADYATEVSSAINSVLYPREPGKAPLGKAEIGPGGLLLVTAPESVQSGVRALLDDLMKNRPEAARSVTITYWAVVGRRAREADVPAALSEVAMALEAFSSPEAPLAFSLLERLTLQSLSGERAQLAGSRHTVSQNVTIHQDGVLARISIEALDRSSINTTVQLASNQLLVLGQSGLRSDQQRADAAGASVFYIVRASVQP